MNTRRGVLKKMIVATGMGPPADINEKPKREKEVKWLAVPYCWHDPSHEALMVYVSENGKIFDDDSLERPIEKSQLSRIIKQVKLNQFSVIWFVIVLQENAANQNSQIVSDFYQSDYFEMVKEKCVVEFKFGNLSALFINCKHSPEPRTLEIGKDASVKIDHRQVVSFEECMKQVSIWTNCHSEDVRAVKYTELVFTVDLEFLDRPVEFKALLSLISTLNRATTRRIRYDLNFRR
jgi:hypothetical protein